LNHANSFPATLHDIGTKLNTDSQAEWKISVISGLTYSLSPSDLKQYLKSQGYDKVLGRHYFTGTTPTFNLFNVDTNPKPLTLAEKQAEMKAPQSDTQGPYGAVEWLYLVDDAVPSKSQGGIDTVYRVETAAGSPPATCEGRPQYFEIKYTAQYWIYGPK